MHKNSITKCSPESKQITPGFDNMESDPSGFLPHRSGSTTKSVMEIKSAKVKTPQMLKMVSLEMGLDGLVGRFQAIPRMSIWGTIAGWKTNNMTGSPGSDC
jgi:hypothetical protein